MDKKQIITICKSEIAIHKAQVENVALLNTMKARNIKEFAILDKQERNLTFEIGKLDAQNKSTSDLKKQLKNIQKQKEKILIDNNIQPSSLTASYNCKDCKDTGILGGQYCKCLKNKIREKIMQECGIKSTNLHTFNDFNSSIAKSETHKTQLEKIKKIFLDISTKYPETSKSFITLSGLPGVGKSFLTECLASALIEKDVFVSFVSAFEMNNLMLSYHTCFDSKKQDYLDALISPDVLIIDDLGTEPILKNVTLEYLYLILSERSRANRLTVISTNLQPTGILEIYHERIFSRLANKREGLFLQIEGTDLRLSKK